MLILKHFSYKEITGFLSFLPANLRVNRIFVQAFKNAIRKSIKYKLNLNTGMSTKVDSRMYEDECSLHIEKSVNKIRNAVFSMYMGKLKYW